MRTTLDVADDVLFAAKDMAPGAASSMLSHVNLDLSSLLTDMMRDA